MPATSLNLVLISLIASTLNCFAFLPNLFKNVVGSVFLNIYTVKIIGIKGVRNPKVSERALENLYFYLFLNITSARYGLWCFY